MAITNFIPELWDAAVQVPYENSLIFAQPNVVNRDYEGTIQQMGDTVNVTSVGKPTIKKYDKNTDLVFEDLTDTNEKLVIDQGDYFGFRVNDVEKVQAAGNFQGPATVSAGTGLRDTVDKYISGLFEPGALTANKLGRVNVLNADPDYVTTGQLSAYDVIVQLREKLDRQSVPQEGRFVIVDATFISCLLLDDRYTDLSKSGSTEGLLNGQVGRATGFNVLVSNNTSKVGGSGAAKDDMVISAGVPGALSFASQLTEVEALREEKRFADLVRGLNIYGAKVFRPEGIATATVTYAPRVFPTP